MANGKYGRFVSNSAKKVECVKQHLIFFYGLKCRFLRFLKPIAALCKKEPTKPQFLDFDTRLSYIWTFVVIFT